MKLTKSCLYFRTKWYIAVYKPPFAPETQATFILELLRMSTLYRYTVDRYIEKTPPAFLFMGSKPMAPPDFHARQVHGSTRSDDAQHSPAC